jgi:hypothetical protein
MNQIFCSQSTFTELKVCWAARNREIAIKRNNHCDFF